MFANTQMRARYEEELSGHMRASLLSDQMLK